jgi:hypothetical protein
LLSRVLIVVGKCLRFHSTELILKSDDQTFQGVARQGPHHGATLRLANLAYMRKQWQTHHQPQSRV